MKNLNDIVITHIQDAYVVNAYPGKRIAINNRQWYGLSFCESGKITYTHRGMKTISTPKVAVILPMHETYELYNNEGGDFPLINFYCENNDFTNKFICIPIQSLDGYLNDFEKIRKNTKAKEDRLKSISVLYDIFYNLSLEQQDPHGIINNIKQYINKNIRNPKLSNQIIAEYVNISEVYLRKLFKKKYNITPKQYILDRRIDLAKQLLSQSGDNITSVSEQCGFSNVFHFCRIFKKKTGRTPSDYRDTHRFIGI